ncbi:hypothetical protein [Sphingomonas prati]|uniref:Sel1 repeat family protein n=1 Tax=Sphingomonas prati TaxID=1843237 RepID=A0A7W9F1F1_9SPHN|nr:hypothetical protein [Sphingomonas prati]MBB5729181.1 hypothetical protein [Sphingomonas prati]GGE84475.1 hypothetical protein GCM10011404_16500 [Sphingomonas prati]
MGQQLRTAGSIIDDRIAEATRGDVDALLDLGMAYSSGGGGIGLDLVEAHKWFNLAALNGSERGQQCRAEIAEDMTAREIANAQKAARAWLGVTVRVAA